ncbi:hypothetical protein BJF79_07315 [Actinomadura sp. CNU-125]|nr:hypothetical protein BJF79_07315 [Actinomadura sp. CNU-125]
MIKHWENGKHAPRKHYRPLYAKVTGKSEEELFQDEADPGPSDPLAMLLAEPDVGSGPVRLPAVERVEGMLRRLYRLEAEFGGDELVAVVAEQVTVASRVFSTSMLDLRGERRLYLALAGLTQIAGWLAIDAARPGVATRHLSAAVYAAHEISDLGLAAHAMGYMSLHHLYQDNPRKALAMAGTASALAQAEGSHRTRAILHQRVARAHAALGEADACRRSLDRARGAYAAGAADPEPPWTAYVTEVEIAAQRGACLLDLGLYEEAVEEIQRTIALLETAAPDHLRDLAHYKTRLASAHLRQGEPGQAAEVAGQAHGLALQIGSARVNERFDDLVTELEPFDVPQVRDLVELVKGR